MKQSGPAAKVRQSLNLGGDGDELQLLDDLERTFAVKFDYKELGTFSPSAILKTRFGTVLLKAPVTNASTPWRSSNCAD
jgi:hypothetical protein